jgi:hypothetical protein
MERVAVKFFYRYQKTGAEPCMAKEIKRIKLHNTQLLHENKKNVPAAHISSYRKTINPSNENSKENLNTNV